MIAMLLLVFMAGTSMFFVAMSDRGGSVEKLVNYNQEMVLAKEALIAFAANYPDLYPGPNNGPGRFPCPDNNLAGLPEASCNDGVEMTYRLPIYANTPNSGPFYFSRQFIEASQESAPDIDYSQFWYALSNGYATDDANLNSTSPAQLVLNGSPNYVALIIAPGEPLAAQTRSTENNRNNRNNYLETPNNNTDTGVFSNHAEPSEPPEPFNDRIVGITRAELMTAVTMKVAIEIKQALDNHHESLFPLPGALEHPLLAFYDYDICITVGDPCYPREDMPAARSCGFLCTIFGLPPLPPAEDIPHYESVMFDAVDDGSMAAWYEDDEWRDVIEYDKISDNEVELRFEDCAIVYTLKYDSEPEIERSEHSC